MPDEFAIWQRYPKAFTLTASAAFYVVRVRLGLSLSSFRSMRRHYLPATLPAPSGGWPNVGQVVRAVHRAARLVPDASCLTEAFALQVMLARRGVSSTLVLGVAGNSDAFAAHAWLEVGGIVVAGGKASPQTFASLARFEATHK